MPLPRRNDMNFDPALVIGGRPFLQSTMGESIGATVQDPLLYPTKLIDMWAERKRLGGSTNPLFMSMEAFESGALFGRGTPDPELTPQQKELLNPDQIEQQYGHLGLKYSEPTPRAVVDFDAKNKRAELQRAEILQNAPGGVLAGTARFGTALAASAVDPLNIASAFIPVIGPVGRSALAMRYGVVAQRAIEGGLAGAAGNIAVLPAIYGLSNQLQMDYSMGDALRDVAFGTILGGGLHVLGGGLNAQLLKRGARRRIAGMDSALERGAEIDPNTLTRDVAREFREAQGNRAMYNAMIPESVQTMRAIEHNLNANRWLDTRAAIQPRPTIGASPEALAGAARVAIAQTAQGQQVNVAPIFEADRSLQEKATVEAPLRQAAPITAEEANRSGRGGTSAARPEGAKTPPTGEESANRVVSERLMHDWQQVKSARGRGRPPKDDKHAPVIQQLEQAGITLDMTEAQARAQAERVASSERRRRVLSRQERAEALEPHTESLKTMAVGKTEWEDYADLVTETFTGERAPKEQFTEAEAEEFDTEAEALIDTIEQEMIAAREGEAPGVSDALAEAIATPKPESPAKPSSPEAPPRPQEPPKPPKPGREPESGAIKAYSKKASDEISAGQVDAEGKVGVFEFDASKLEVDAKRFQFKSGGDEFGVTKKLKGVKTFSRTMAGQLVVWEALDGKVYVANGHQRVGLAKRVKAENPEADTTVSAALYREKDGVSAEEAMVIGAIVNISEGQGDVIDFAKMARALPDDPRVKEAMRISDEKQRVTFDLAHLNDSAWGLVVNGIVSPKYASLVGRFVPDDTVRQNAAMDLLAKAEPRSEAEAESLVRQVAAEELVAAREGEQPRFPWEDAAAETLILEKAKVVATFGRIVRQDRRIFNMLGKQKGRIEAAGNKLSEEQNAAIAARAGELEAYVNANAYRKGPISDALTKAAQEVKAGVPVATAARGFAEAIAREIPESGRGRQEAGAPPRAGKNKRESGPGDESLIASFEDAGQGTRNFVLFNDKDVEITDVLAKFGPDGPRERVIDGIGRLQLLDQSPEIAAFVKRLPEGIDFRFTTAQPKNRPPGALLQGAYSPMYRTLWLTSAALDPMKTLRHEHIHALRDLGLFTDAEWQILSERAGKLEDWAGPKTVQHYREWNAKFYHNDPAKFEDSLQEEAVARMVEAYGAGARFGSKIDAILARISEFFEALRNAARGLGFQSSADVLRAIESGEIGARAQEAKLHGYDGLLAKLSDQRDELEARAARLRAEKAPSFDQMRALREVEGQLQGLDVAARATTGREFAASQPERTFDEIYKIAPVHQTDLINKGQAIADSLPDTTFEFPPAEASEPGSPGLKRRATAEAKIDRKGYKTTSQLTDVVRAMFVSGKPEHGDSVVQALAKTYDIFDEGWQVTPSGYFDRKILIRFDDGMIGEVQIQEPHLTEAKMKKGGHDFYEKERSLPPGDPEREKWVKKQQELYAAAVAEAGPEWAPIIEGIGGRSGKAALKASSEITAPESPTSAESTSVQSSPGASTAKAREGDQTAGRPSQFTNMTDEAISNEIGLGDVFGKTEKTAAGEQAVLPGAERISDKQLAERKSAGGKKASAPQKDTGGLPLFDDYQTDLLEFARTKNADAAVQKAKDLEPAIHGIANCMARRG